MRLWSSPVLTRYFFHLNRLKLGAFFSLKEIWNAHLTTLFQRGLPFHHSTSLMSQHMLLSKEVLFHRAAEYFEKTL